MVAGNTARPSGAGHVIVIFNPVAGTRRVSRLWSVLDILATSGVRVELARTQARGDAERLAREAAAGGSRLVVAAGGDGTIAEVAAGLAGSPARLGVIPLGTANVLAGELALPREPRAIAAALAFGRTRRLWPGIATGAAGSRLFVQMLGVGLDALVVHRLAPGLKRALGRSAYVLQTLREMVRYPYPQVHVRLDGEAALAGSVIVSKGQRYAGRFTLAPGARPDAPGFSVALLHGAGPGVVLGYGAALTLNLLPHMPGVELRRAREVEIGGDGFLPAQADGDPAGAAPISVRDAPAPIEIVCGG
jgi:diacylglycerol kinase (ATP)